MTLPSRANPQDSPFPSIRASLGNRRLTLEPPPQYAVAVINITNHCNLACKHCFVYRDGNPNDPEGEMSPEQVLSEVKRLRDRHGVQFVIWMGGEPMLRKPVLAEGVKLFRGNTIATNGSVPLEDFGDNVTYVISLDGPPELNDALRGEGVFDRAMSTIAAIPEGFRPRVEVQCVVHRENQDHLDEFVAALPPTRIRGVVFTFLVPEFGEVSPRAWESVEERESAIDIIFELKRRYPGFVLNSTRSLDLMRPATAKLVTDHCPTMKVAVPLYMDGDHFTSTLCPYGNNADCDRCGSWAVFVTAAGTSGPWDDVLPPGSAGRG
jgi:MoaA/NifB/PqqE/SkfB family radical SAM enzyme